MLSEPESLLESLGFECESLTEDSLSFDAESLDENLTLGWLSDCESDSDESECDCDDSLCDDWLSLESDSLDELN